jgi:phosphate transport system protein
LNHSVEQELEKLKQKVLEMGVWVEKAVQHALLGLMSGERSHLQAVLDAENKIDTYHVQLDQDFLDFFATQAPRAKDLRLIIALVKINADLERMGDQAKNIIQNAGHYLRTTSWKGNVALQEMSEIVQQMIRETLEALFRDDLSLAEKILKDDNRVDALKGKLLVELLSKMKKDTLEVEPALELILIAKNLERLGDHATNIAEDVIFVCTGKDIRHHNLAQEVIKG